jgi:predicted transcriptional regulator of viral defense system
MVRPKVLNADGVQHFRINPLTGYYHGYTILPMKTTLGRMETQFFAYAQMRQLQKVETGDAAKALGLSPRQELKLLSRLARAGMIARVWRGVYLVPPRLPLGGKWSPGAARALNALMDVLKARYQVCGPSAFNRYGYSDQVPNRLYVYNNRLSGVRTVGTVSLTLIKVADARLGGTEAGETRDGKPLVYSSRARTLVDAVYDWARFGSLPEAYEWITNDVKTRVLEASELVGPTLKYGDVGTVRRMGVVLEQADVSPALLRRLARTLRPSASTIAWIPVRPKRGPANVRWGVTMNDKS